MLKSVFFPQIIKKDNIPLRLADLNINVLTVERESPIKCLGVRIDENLTCRDHIHTVENKIAKNIKESITVTRIFSSKSTLLTYMLI